MSLAVTRRAPMRGSTLAAAVFGGLVLLLLGLAAATGRGEDPADRRARAAELVASLALSDLALFTEARYTRNPSLADLHSAFQDGPTSLEHFPTGSLVVAPRRFRDGRLGGSEE